MTTTVDVPTGGQDRYEELRWLADTYMQVQKIRIANSNREFASTEGLDSNHPAPFLVGMIDRLEDLEDIIFNEMKIVVKDHPCWNWLNQVKGIGPTLSTKVLGLIGDVERFTTVSKLWIFSGYGLRPKGAFLDLEDPDKKYKPGEIILPRNGYAYQIEQIHDTEKLQEPDEWTNEMMKQQRVGKFTVTNIGFENERQRPVKGEKLGYNRRLKTALYLVGDSFIKTRAPYRRFYDASKQRYYQNKQVSQIRHYIPNAFDGGVPDRSTKEGKKEWDELIAAANAATDIPKAVWTDGHVDKAARRYMVKIFLSHLWEVWRTEEGFSTRPPYVHEYLNHKDYIGPWEMVGR